MDSDDAALLCLANLGSGLWPAEEIMTKMTNLLNVFLFKIKRVIDKATKYLLGSHIHNY